MNRSIRSLILLGLHRHNSRMGPSAGTFSHITAVLSGSMPALCTSGYIERWPRPRALMPASMVVSPFLRRLSASLAWRLWMRLGSGMCLCGCRFSGVDLVSICLFWGTCQLNLPFRGQPCAPSCCPSPDVLGTPVEILLFLP